MPTDLTAAGALAAAQAQLISSGLSIKYGLSGGAFDPAGETLLDPSGENDWLVPYERGGVYTGDLLISALTTASSKKPAGTKPAKPPSPSRTLCKSTKESKPVFTQMITRSTFRKRVRSL